MQLASAVADRIEPAPQLPSGSGSDHEASADVMTQEAGMKLLLLDVLMLAGQVRFGRWSVYVDQGQRRQYSL